MRALGVLLLATLLAVVPVAAQAADPVKITADQFVVDEAAHVGHVRAARVNGRVARALGEAGLANGATEARETSLGDERQGRHIAQGLQQVDAFVLTKTWGRTSQVAYNIVRPEQYVDRPKARGLLQ